MAALLVIGYDGSIDAKHAIAAVDRLDADRALIVNVWQPPLAAAGTDISMGGAPVLPKVDAEEQLQAAARRIADDGAARAGAAGLEAETMVVRGESTSDIGRTLARVAEERQAAAIVVGRRGVSRLAAAVLGSVSDATVREAHCPVLVVPAPDED